MQLNPVSESTFWQSICHLSAKPLAALALVLALALPSCIPASPSSPLSAEAPLPPPAATPPLEIAARAFLSGRYAEARHKYSTLAVSDTSSTAARHSARYGLACTDLATAQDPNAFVNAMESFLQSFPVPAATAPQTGPKNPGLKDENPELLATGIRHGLDLLNSERKAAREQIAQMAEKEKKLMQERQKMQRLIKTLKHQISGLESIDHERQEKRKVQ